MRLGTAEIILIVILALVLLIGCVVAGVGRMIDRSFKDFASDRKDRGAKREESGEDGSDKKS